MATTQDSADRHLEQYGYKPEFDRTLKRFASFAIGFSFISITTGIFTTYGVSAEFVGPARHLDLADRHRRPARRSPGLRRPGGAHAAGRLHLPVDVAPGQPACRLAGRLVHVRVSDRRCGRGRLCGRLDRGSRAVRLRGHDGQRLVRDRCRHPRAVPAHHVLDALVGAHQQRRRGHRADRHRRPHDPHPGRRRHRQQALLGAPLQQGRGGRHTPLLRLRHAHPRQPMGARLPARRLHDRRLRGLRQPGRGDRRARTRRAARHVDLGPALGHPRLSPS